MRVLLDTSILVRLSRAGDSNYARAASAIPKLIGDGYEICIVPQVFYEFWSVATRPANANGLGLSIDEAKLEIETFCHLAG